MAKLTRPYRGQKSSKRMDMTDMRKLFEDRRMYASIGTVTKPSDIEHFEIVSDETGTPVDVTVEVILQPSLVPATCRIAATVWTVPEDGEEVAVLIPEGDPGFMPIIVAVLSSNSVPATQGPALGTISIVRGQVLVHDGAGGAVALALKSDIDATNAQLGSHSHTVAGVSAGGSTLPSGPPTTPAPTAVGTTVFKAK